VAALALSSSRGVFANIASFLKELALERSSTVYTLKQQYLARWLMATKSATEKNWSSLPLFLAPAKEDSSSRHHSIKSRRTLLPSPRPVVNMELKKYEQYFLPRDAL